MSDKRPPARVSAFFQDQQWAILPSYFETMVAVLSSDRGIEGRQARMEAVTPTGQVSFSPPPPTIAVIPLMGIITPRASFFADVSQEGVALSKFMVDYEQAMTNPNIGGVIVVGDTPGGACHGIPDAADRIFELRGAKPNVFIGAFKACSAGYWLAAQFAEVVGAQGSDWGAVGVICCRPDVSGYDQKEGLKFNYIAAPAGGFKSEGQPHEPMTDEEGAYLQARVDETYQVMTKQISRGREEKRSDVAALYGKGRVMSAASALKAGMIDRIGTVDSEVQRMASKLSKKGGGSATRADSSEAPQLVAGEVPPAVLDVRSRLLLARPRGLASGDHG